MQLIFEGHSTIERGFDGVKFVGCCRESQDRDRYIPCRVTREALEQLLMHTLDNSAQALLDAYQSKSEIINRIASAQFSGDLTGSFCTKRNVRNRLGREFCHGEEEV
jgi:hypothetical protein